VPDVGKCRLRDVLRLSLFPHWAYVRFLAVKMGYDLLRPLAQENDLILVDFDRKWHIMTESLESTNVGFFTENTNNLVSIIDTRN